MELPSTDCWLSRSTTEDEAAATTERWANEQYTLISHIVVRVKSEREFEPRLRWLARSQWSEDAQGHDDLFHQSFARQKDHGLSVTTVNR